jgi:hypothetical protein
MAKSRNANRNTRLPEEKHKMDIVQGQQTWQQIALLTPFRGTSRYIHGTVSPKSLIPMEFLRITYQAYAPKGWRGRGWHAHASYTGAPEPLSISNSHAQIPPVLIRIRLASDPHLICI